MDDLFRVDDVCPCRVGARCSVARLRPASGTERKDGTGGKDRGQEQENFRGRLQARPKVEFRPIPATDCSPSALRGKAGALSGSEARVSTMC